MTERARLDPSEVFVYRGRGSVPKNVRRVDVRPSVTYLPDRLFESCPQLESVRLREGLLHIGKYAFARCSSLRNFRCPSTVAEIGRGAFEGCSNLEEVALPEGLREVRPYAFHKCASLGEVTIPSSVTMIGDCAFWDCTSLASIELREGVKIIGWRSFKNCSLLEHLRIPSSIDEIGGWAFDGCTGLSLIRLHEHLPRMKRFAFRGCPPRSFQFVRLLERAEALRMDERTASVFEGRLNQITTAMTRTGNYDDWEAAGAIWGRCKKRLGRVREFLTYLELSGSMPTLELALWKARIEDEPEERLRGDLPYDQDGGQDEGDAARARKRRRLNRLSREGCRVKCGAGIVSVEVRKFFAYDMSWPQLDGPE